MFAALVGVRVASDSSEHGAVWLLPSLDFDGMVSMDAGNRGMGSGHVMRSDYTSQGGSASVQREGILVNFGMYLLAAVSTKTSKCSYHILI